MLNVKFEEYKLERELKRCGTEFDFYRYATNEYGEPDKESDMISVGSLTGILHETNATSYYVTRRSTDQSTVRSYRNPMILAKYDDVEALGIALGDVVTLSEKFVVTGWVNVQSWGIYAEISLERLDDGE